MKIKKYGSISLEIDGGIELRNFDLDAEGMSPGNQAPFCKAVLDEFYAEALRRIIANHKKPPILENSEFRDKNGDLI